MAIAQKQLVRINKPESRMHGLYAVILIENRSGLGLHYVQLIGRNHRNQPIECCWHFSPEHLLPVTQAELDAAWARWTADE